MHYACPALGSRYLSTKGAIVTRLRLAHTLHVCTRIRCVCVRERERESVCVNTPHSYIHTNVCMCVYVCVCVCTIEEMACFALTNTHMNQRHRRNGENGHALHKLTHTMMHQWREWPCFALTNKHMHQRHRRNGGNGHALLG